MEAKSATTTIVASKDSQTSLSNILLSSKLVSHMSPAVVGKTLLNTVCVLCYIQILRGAWRSMTCNDVIQLVSVEPELKQGSRALHV